MINKDVGKERTVVDTFVTLVGSDSDAFVMAKNENDPMVLIGYKMNLEIC